MSVSAPERISQANVYVLQGDDELAVRDYLKGLVSQLQVESPMDLDVVYLDGRSADRAAFTQVLNSLSLLSPKRLVVLEDALEALRAKDAKGWLAETLQQLPDSCVFVLQVSDSQRYSRGNMVWGKGQSKTLAAPMFSRLRQEGCLEGNALTQPAQYARLDHGPRPSGRAGRAVLMAVLLLSWPIWWATTCSRPGRRSPKRSATSALKER